MRAHSSQSQEMDIFLSPEEVSCLETTAIQGRIVFRDREGRVCFERPVEVVLTDRGSAKNYFAGLESFPRHADFESIEKYKVMIYRLGYQQLIANSQTGDRIETARVNLFRE